jgi:hypothetical protein
MDLQARQAAGAAATHTKRSSFRGEKAAFSSSFFPFVYKTGRAEHQLLSLSTTPT